MATQVSDLITALSAQATVITNVGTVLATAQAGDTSAPDLTPVATAIAANTAQLQALIAPPVAPTAAQ